MVPKTVFKGLDDLLVRRFFRDSVEDNGSPDLQDRKQTLGFTVGVHLYCPATASNWWRNTVQDIDPSDFGVSTLPVPVLVVLTTPCAARASFILAMFRTHASSRRSQASIWRDVCNSSCVSSIFTLNLQRRPSVHWPTDAGATSIQILVVSSSLERMEFMAVFVLGRFLCHLSLLFVVLLRSFFPGWHLLLH